jgi:hypothetical protein
VSGPRAPRVACDARIRTKRCYLATGEADSGDTHRPCRILVIPKKLLKTKQFFANTVEMAVKNQAEL